MVRRFVMRSKWKLAPVISWRFWMVDPPLPMRISGSSPAEMMTEVSPDSSSTGSSDRKGASARASSAAASILAFCLVLVVTTSCHSSTMGTVSHCSAEGAAGLTRTGRADSSRALPAFFFFLRLRFFFSPVAAGAVSSLSPLTAETEAPFFLAFASTSAFFFSSSTASAANAACIAESSFSLRVSASASAAASAAATTSADAFSSALVFSSCLFNARMRSRSLLAAMRLVASVAPLRWAPDWMRQRSRSSSDSSSSSSAKTTFLGSLDVDELAAVAALFFFGFFFFFLEVFGASGSGSATTGGS
mmetsp:Transcript_23363/g.41877  ORF Transcript_23363/g.41877 Transcript_23363/m.41877 type:complete len:304 (-) Transcript_23363:768-1679(-)